MPLSKKTKFLAFSLAPALLLIVLSPLAFPSSPQSEYYNYLNIIDYMEYLPFKFALAVLLKQTLM
jgi:hypothetical protein